MHLKVYLSGEIHSNWRDEIINKCNEENLEIEFSSPTTNHELSDNVGAQILGNEEKKIWHDNKSAKINAIKTRLSIEKSDIVIIRFGDKYKQWNAAFDAGYASALNKSLIIMHDENNQHALKEIDAAALAVVKNTNEIIKILNYTINGKI